MSKRQRHVPGAPGKSFLCVTVQVLQGTDNAMELNVKKIYKEYLRGEVRRKLQELGRANRLQSQSDSHKREREGTKVGRRVLDQRHF